MKTHFRVDTPQLLKEIVRNGLRENSGVLQVPLKVLINFLEQLAERCTEINDPVLDRIMFDMNLYDLPSPTSEEYSKIMDDLYKAEKEYLKNKKK